MHPFAAEYRKLVITSTTIEKRRNGCLGDFVVDSVFDVLDTPTPTEYMAHIMDALAAAGLEECQPDITRTR